MTKKILASVGIATSAALLATALVAGAQTTSSMPSAPSSEPQILNVGRQGNVVLRGTIASISGDTIMVNGWGGVWTVIVPSSTSILPAAAGSDITQFKAGDFIGVQGLISTSANWSVQATLVRDWTYRAAVAQQEKVNVQAAQGIRKSGPRDYIGTASNLSGSSFTLAASNGTSYTVNTASNVEIVNRNWITIPLASVQNGDNIRVYGVNTSGTIIAQIIRDVTLRIATATSSVGH